MVFRHMGRSIGLHSGREYIKGQGVTYGCEMWVLKENTKLKLQLFERKVLRRIYGPTKEYDGTWRIKSNEELNRLDWKQKYHKPH